MAGRDVPDLRRRKATREPQRRFVIVCEGQNTEPAYFEALAATMRDVRLHIIRAAGVPMTIADRAMKELPSASRSRRKRDSYEENDEVWAVFDRDEHPQHAQAVGFCDARGIKVARSNPCFELWLILHFSDFDRPDGRRKVQEHLQSICPDYDKNRGKRPDCASFIDKMEDAETRAERQLRAREGEGTPYGPPSTTVFKLTRAIRHAAALSRGNSPQH